MVEDNEAREFEEMNVVRSVEESSDTTALAVGIDFVLIQIGLERTVRWVKICEKREMENCKVPDRGASLTIFSVKLFVALFVAVSVMFGN